MTRGSGLLTIADFTPEQRAAVGRGIRWPEMALFMDVGTGKSCVGLTLIQELRKRGMAKRPLVVAPLRVCQTAWPVEALKWKHTKDLVFSYINGTLAARKKAYRQAVDIALVNYENLEWLTEQDNEYDFIIYDEVSKMADPSSLRFKAAYQRWDARKIGLTATPASNGLTKLFGEYKIIDEGKSLGTSVEAFRMRFFNYNQHTRRYYPAKTAKQRIFHLARAITYAVENPTKIFPTVKDIIVKPALRVRERYDELERNFFVELEDQELLTVVTAAALSNKLLQFANGTVYLGSPFDKPREWAMVHDAKFKALDKILAKGKPTLICYSYKMDRYRLQERYGCPDITDYKDARVAIKEFDKLLIGHPASMAHGIDGLQHRSSTLVWFGLPWSLENYEQSIGRLARMGQKKEVMMYRILMEDSMDMVVSQALAEKASTQHEFLKLMQTYSRGKYNAIGTTAPSHSAKDKQRSTRHPAAIG